MSEQRGIKLNYQTAGLKPSILKLQNRLPQEAVEAKTLNGIKQ